MHPSVFHHAAVEGGWRRSAPWIASAKTATRFSELGSFRFESSSHCCDMWPLNVAKVLLVPAVQTENFSVTLEVFFSLSLKKMHLHPQNMFAFAISIKFREPKKMHQSLNWKLFYTTSKVDLLSSSSTYRLPKKKKRKINKKLNH